MNNVREYSHWIAKHSTNVGDYGLISRALSELETAWLAELGWGLAVVGLASYLPSRRHEPASPNSIHAQEEFYGCGPKG